MNHWIYHKEILATIFLISFFILLRVISNRTIQNLKKMPVENKRNLIVNLKNILYLLFFLGLFAVWFSQIQTFALSVVAVAAALVLATKELILNLLGGVQLTVTRPFKIGDRVEIKKIRGDVISYNFLSTTILEVGPGTLFHQYTGRSIEFPNSFLLNSSITNESYTQKFVVHTFTVPIKRDNGNWKKAERILLEAAEVICKEYMEEAKKHMKNIGKVRNLEPPNVTPRVSIHFPNPEVINLVLRIPALAVKKGRIEQEIIRYFLNKFP